MSVDLDVRTEAPAERAAPAARALAVLGVLIVLIAAALPVVLPQARRSFLPGTIVLMLALPLIGLRTLRSGVTAARELFTGNKAIWSIALLLFLALPVLSGFYVQIYDYLSTVAFAAFGFLIVLGLAARFSAESTQLADWAVQYRVATLLVLVLVLSALACVFVLDNVPHVSDEVAYQFQARALAQGRLYIQPPQEFEFFEFLHTIRDGSKWYGIMNPGWPALLSIGYVLHAPWLINPVLGALALLVLFSFYRKAGFSEPETRIAVLLLAVSPLVLFMSGTYMSHAANLLLFALFLWGWISFLTTERLMFALLAGAAVALNMLVRPIDTAVASAPFLLYATWQTLRKPKLWPGLIVLGVVASAGVVLTWAYNQQLTGNWRLMPVTKYFNDLNPHEKFGLGFGAEMGTKIHGPEWPGYFLGDAVRVTSYRLEEFFRDFNALPLLFIAGLAYGARRRFWNWRSQPAYVLLMVSALGLVAIYFLHFYHGVAYGSRHYYLALPGVAVMLARPLASWLGSVHSVTARRARVLLAATLVFTATLPYGRLVAEYGRNYRGASGDLRAAVNRRGLENAVVFVAQGGLWGWKSAFPLNTYPLESSRVIFAKDRGADNQRIMRLFPGRTFYVAHVRGAGVEIRPLARAAAGSD